MASLGEPYHSRPNGSALGVTAYVAVHTQHGEHESKGLSVATI